MQSEIMLVHYNLNMHELFFLRTISMVSFAWLKSGFESSFLFHLKRRTNKVMSLMENELCNN